MSKHTCHAQSCSAEIVPELLMCLHHWRLVPKKMQQRILAAYREGQCDDKQPSAEWLEAAKEAIDAVFEKETKMENERRRKEEERCPFCRGEGKIVGFCPGWYNEGGPGMSGRPPPSSECYTCKGTGRSSR